MQTAASDWAASRLAVAIERVAVALLAEDEEMQNGAGIVRATTVMRPALKIERCEQFYTDTDARSAQTYSYGALPVISPRLKSAQDPSHCDSDGRQSPAEGTEPRGRVNSLSVGVCLV